jgi:site-specific DNA-methyltransferase (adenine-specific)
MKEVPMGRRPGEVRDAIIRFFDQQKGKEATISEIRQAVNDNIGDVPASSVRSYLRLNTPDMFKRTGHGRYKLINKGFA